MAGLASVVERCLASVLVLYIAGTAARADECGGGGQPASFTAASAWQEVRAALEQDYAYVHRIDARAVFEAAAPALLDASDRLAFADRLETLLLLFRDGHLHVSPTSKPAMAWVPSGTDLWFAWRGNQVVVDDVKQGSVAWERGVRPGWVLLGMEGHDAAAAARQRFASIGVSPGDDQLLYAINAMGSGLLGQVRHFAFRVAGQVTQLSLPPGYDSVRRPEGRLTVATTHDRGGRAVTVLRINNSLGDNRLIEEFDEALAALPAGARIIIDLRDTPGGGNSTVARSIMGHFVRAALPYQKHELTAERVQYGVPRVWLEYVQPRAPSRQAPVVLAGRWTGSMGEGMVIGLESAAHAQTVGSPMAGLLGALAQQTLPASCLAISYGNERLWHVDGRPREDYSPRHRVQPADALVGDHDLALELAVRLTTRAPASHR